MNAHRNVSVLSSERYHSLHSSHCLHGIISTFRVPTLPYFLSQSELDEAIETSDVHPTCGQVGGLQAVLSSMGLNVPDSLQEVCHAHMTANGTRKEERNRRQLPLNSIEDVVFACPASQRQG